MPYCRSNSSLPSPEPPPSRPPLLPPAQRSVPYIVSGRRQRSHGGLPLTAPACGQRGSARAPACAAQPSEAAPVSGISAARPPQHSGEVSSGGCSSGGSGSDDSNASSRGSHVPAGSSSCVSLSPAAPPAACHPHLMAVGTQPSGRQPLTEADTTVLSLSERFRNMKSTVQQRLAFGKQATWLVDWPASWLAGWLAGWPILTV